MMSISIPRQWRSLALATGLLLASYLPATAQTWQWANAPGIGDATATAFDAAGNVYITGVLTGPATFGNQMLTPHSLGDLFVAKISPSGIYDWVTQTSGSGFCNGKALTVDAQGAVVVTGYINNDIVFGATTLNNGPFTTGFVAQLSATGQWQWARAFGNQIGRAYGEDVMTDASGAVFITGSCHAGATFGAFTPPNAGFTDGFVGKLTTGGQWQWVTTFGGPGYEDAYTIASSSGDTLLVGGICGPNATFGATPIPTNYPFNAFVAQLQGATNWQWVRSFGSATGNTIVADLASSTGGAITIAGSFWDAITLGSSALVSRGEADGFVARLDRAGQWQWANRFGAINQDFVYSVDADAAGTVTIGGRFIDSTRVGLTALTSTGRSGGVVAQCTSGGVWLGAEAIGGSNNEAVASVGARTGVMVVTGAFASPTLSLNPFTLPRVTSQYSTMFIAQRGGFPTGVPAAVVASAFTLAPNPATATVRLLGLTPAAPPAVLLDGLGRVVRTGSTALDVRGLPAGLYLVRVGTASQRLVVE